MNFLQNCSSIFLALSGSLFFSLFLRAVLQTVTRQPMSVIMLEIAPYRLKLGKSSTKHHNCLILTFTEKGSRVVKSARRQNYRAPNPNWSESKGKSLNKCRQTRGKRCARTSIGHSLPRYILTCSARRKVVFQNLNFLKNFKNFNNLPKELNFTDILRRIHT